MKLKIVAMMIAAGVPPMSAMAERLPPTHMDGTPGGGGSGGGGDIPTTERVISVAPKFERIPQESVRVNPPTGSPAARFGRITERREFRGAETSDKNKDTSEKDCGSYRGNPIDISTGNKQEFETDFVTQGEWPLYLKRTYSSRGSDHQGPWLFYPSAWRSNFDYGLSFELHHDYYCSANFGDVECTPHANTSGVKVHRPDGRSILFIKLSDGVFVDNKASPLARVVRQTDGSWVLYGEDNTVEHYSKGGFPLSIPNESGITWTFQYGGLNGTQLQRVVHTSGRAVDFVWEGRQLSEVRDPAGNAYRYAWSSALALKTATFPGSNPTVVTYHYGREPGEPDVAGLTGKSYNGARYSWFGYANGMATSTEHVNGIDRYTFAYGNGADGTRTVVETNPLGKQAIHVFKNNKPLSITGQPSAHCPGTNRQTTYDAYGYEDLVTDFAGGRVDYDYDAHGHLIRQVDGVGTPVARVTHRAWDEARNQLSSLTIEGQGRVDYTYGAGNRVQTVTVVDQASGQSRTTHYSYALHPNGLLATATVDGPLPNDTIARRYSAQGDLLEVSNGMGHTVRYSHHNALGQPGRVTGPAGALTDYTYDARGRIVLERTYPSGSPVDTRYVYGASGLLDAVHYADGNIVMYHYDAARRLTQEDRTDPSGGYEVKRFFYNANSQPVRVEVGRDR